MPLPVKPEMAPPEAVTSFAANVVLAAERVKVTSAVELLPSVGAATAVMVTVGWTVLTGSASAPATLGLVAASEKAPAATAMLAAPVNPGVGVKVAV